MFLAHGGLGDPLDGREGAAIGWLAMGGFALGPYFAGGNDGNRPRIETFSEMNPRVLLTPLLIATLIASSPSLFADEGKLDGFKKEVAALKAEVKAKFPAVAEDSAAAMDFSRAMMKKIAAVKTDALPDDLKQAWAGLTTYAQKFNALFHGWPADNARLRAFIKAKTKDDPEYMDRLGDQMLTLSSEAGDAMDKLEEVARKYGIDPEGLIPGQAAAREFSEP